jgi:GT2 family glycosyltransferase
MSASHSGVAIRFGGLVAVECCVNRIEADAVVSSERLLDKRLPQSEAQRAEFMQSDPGRPDRRSIDLLRLAEGPRPLLLFIAHAWGGGIRRHMSDLAGMVSERCETLLLEPAIGDVVKLSWLKPGEDFSGYFSLPEDVNELVSLLRYIGVARMHFHHIHGLPRSVLDLPGAVGVPYDCTLHDYYAICPQYHLVTEEGRYCGEPDEAGCTACLSKRPAQWGLDIVTWRSAFEQLLRGSERVIAPSRDVARRIARHFPDVGVLVIPHPETKASVSPPFIRVVTLGTLSREKGLRVVAACATDARARSLPLTFRVLGSTTEPVPQWPDVALSIHGQYADGDLPKLLAAEKPDVIWMPAQVPESYSYTLSMALASGYPIVASDLGAFAERLAGQSFAALVPWNATPAEWNDVLLRTGDGRRPRAREQADEPDKPASDSDRYLAQYLLPVSPRSASQPRPSKPLAISNKHWYEPMARDGAPELSMRQLFIAGVECGHSESRAELKRRVATADATFEELQIVRNRTHGDVGGLAAQLLSALREPPGTQMRIGQLETMLRAARARIDELESSTTWRATAPIRRIGHRVKIAAARLRAQWAMVRQSPRYLLLAITVLRDEGPAALGRRIWRRLARQNWFRPAGSNVFSAETEIRPLAFVESKDPRVTIIVPMYGKPLLTYTCLKSVHANSAAGSYEVLVVDDASPEVAAMSLAAVTGVRFIRNETNVGFVRSCNNAAALARGTILVFLNNDTIVTPGWLEALTAVLREHPDAGLVGAKLIYPDGRLQEAGGVVWRDASAWNYGRDDDPHKPEYNYVREVDYCSGACIAVDRTLFDEIGGFDVRFAPAYCEDTDLAFAVRAAGRKVYYQPLATIVHFEGATSGTDLATGAKRHQVINQSAFLAKWADVLRRHRPNGLAPELERDRWARRRVLVIEACMLTPDQDSGSQRTQQVLELLVKVGCKVTFMADNLEYRQPYVTMLQQAGVEVQFHPYARSVAEFLGQHGSEFDVVVVARHYIAAKHIDAVRAFAPNALVVFDTHDLHFLREERLAALKGGRAATAAAGSSREAELALIRKADVTLVVSPVEKDLLDQLLPEAKIMILSNMHELRPRGKPFAEREGLVFIGGFRHPPNTDGVLWYAKEILPRVRDKLPGVRTYIVGSDVPPTIKKLAAEDFIVTGYVADIAPYFTGCRVSISPLRYGAGVKGKVNLAMSYGVPVVATTPSIEGMYLTPGVHVLIGDDPEAFADAVARVYNDEQLWDALAEGGRENVRTHFSHEVGLSAITRLLAFSRDHRPA